MRAERREGQVVKNNNFALVSHRVRSFVRFLCPVKKASITVTRVSLTDQLAKREMCCCDDDRREDTSLWRPAGFHVAMLCAGMRGTDDEGEFYGAVDNWSEGVSENGRRSSGN